MAAEWITPAGRLSSVVNTPNGRELFRWTRTVEAEEKTIGDEVTYQVVDGVLPGGLTLDESTGEIDGVLKEMDSYVPEWSGSLESYDELDEDGNVAVTGGKYATINSAAAGEREFEFTIRATAVTLGTSADRAFSILVVNNWSSDRDRFVREHPSLGEDREKALREQGYLPPLTNA